MFVCLLLFTPLIGFLFLTLASGIAKKSKTLTHVVAVSTIGISFLSSLYFFFKIAYFLDEANTQVYYFTLYEWITLGELYIPFGVQIDALSSIMCLMVTGVGFWIHVFSIFYMKEDLGYRRYFSLLNLFVFFMLVLILSSNYLFLFLGWEGVGLCSYLLIGFWNENKTNTLAAYKAFIMNRIGDFFMLSAILLLLHRFGSVEFKSLFEQVGTLHKGQSEITLIAIFLLGGALAKSAQLPLSTWLPDAMVGPTPVSALIHAATMVTAGVYLILRSNIIFSISPLSLELILFIGVLTSLYSSFLAVIQKDIKKVLAYSTLTHLSFMFIALGLGVPSAALFHTLTHAFYKALLFLGAGMVIHYLDGEQDLSKMGGLRKHLPITHVTFLIGTLSLAGFPPFSGFFSKDEILNNAFLESKLLWMLLLLPASLSSFAIFRLFFLAFGGKERFKTNSKAIYQHGNKHELAISYIPLCVLAIFSTLAGFINLPHFWGGELWLENFIEHLFHTFYFSELNPKNILVHMDIKTEIFLMIMINVCILFTLLLAYYLYIIKNKIPQANTQYLSRFIDLDALYNILFIKPYVKLSNILPKIIEERIILPPIHLAVQITQRLSIMIRLMQSGNLNFYFIGTILGMLLLLMLILIPT